MSNSIFEVDVKGLRQLQAGKPKWFVIRELLQNALDEDIKECDVHLKYENGKAHITVVDDSPTGFRDLSDAYTLFRDTYKRTDATKRGRFNFGEKQVLCLCDYARIVTTTGAIEFQVTAGKRVRLGRKSAKGSEVYVVVRMKRHEFDECVTYINTLKVRSANVHIFKDREIGYNLKVPGIYKEFMATLQTEIKVDEEMKRVQRPTNVYLYKEPTSYIYELGIPICEIDCDYSIDIQQKVPLSPDRDTVDAKYLKTVYGEVLNQTHEEISKEQSSNMWVRTGTTSDRVDKDAVQSVITKRFGEKSLIANPFDRRSMDEAISNNYNVVFGQEMSRDEWDKVKGFGLMESTSEMFKTGIADGRFLKGLEITPEMKSIAEFSKLVAKKFLNIPLSVSFYDSPDATVIADYNSESNHLRFNVAHINESMWKPLAATKPGGGIHAIVQQPMLDLIIHELGHSAGLHYEQSYHECITMLGSKLTCEALTNPDFFKL